MGIENVRIRKYKKEDREMVRRVCCETGYIGKSIDEFFSDRELFANIFASSYTDFEPGCAWVVEDRKNREVVGYLIGALNGRLGEMYVALKGLYSIPHIVKNYFRYDSKSKRFVKWLLFRGVFEKPKIPFWGAESHTNLLPGYRGFGIGIRLKKRFFNYIKKNGVKIAYARTFDNGDIKKMKYWKDLGYAEYARKKTTAWEGKKVYLVTLVNRL